NCATALFWLISWPALQVTAIGRAGSRSFTHWPVFAASRQMAPGNSCGDCSYASRRRTSTTCSAERVAIAFQRSFGEIEKLGDSMGPLRDEGDGAWAREPWWRGATVVGPAFFILRQRIGTINDTPAISKSSKIVLRNAASFSFPYRPKPHQMPTTRMGGVSAKSWSVWNVNASATANEIALITKVANITG